jgi:hypothetical protein
MEEKSRTNVGRKKPQERRPSRDRDTDVDYISMDLRETRQKRSGINSTGSRLGAAGGIL